MKTNPLLSDSQFPQFAQITPAHVLPALEQVLTENRATIESLCDATDPPTWENFAEPLETLDQKVDHLWSPVSHINAVRDSEELRTEVEKALPMLSAYATELGQNSQLYDKFRALADAPEFDRFDTARRTAIVDF